MNFNYMNPLAQDFCRLSVALPLVRNGYSCQTDVNIGTHHFGIKAERIINHVYEQFLVVVIPVEGRPKYESQYRNESLKLEKIFNMKVYTAIVAEDGNTIVADEHLTEKMKYSKHELKVISVPDKTRINDFENDSGYDI